MDLMASPLNFRWVSSLGHLWLTFYQDANSWGRSRFSNIRIKPELKHGEQRRHRQLTLGLIKDHGLTREAAQRRLHYARGANGYLLGESLAVFGRLDKGLDHFGLHEVAAELIKFGEPKLIARIVRVGRTVRVAAQVPEVLHQHEGTVLLATIE